MAIEILQGDPRDKGRIPLQGPIRDECPISDEQIAQIKAQYQLHLGKNKKTETIHFLPPKNWQKIQNKKDFELFCGLKDKKEASIKFIKQNVPEAGGLKFLFDNVMENKKQYLLTSGRGSIDGLDFLWLSYEKDSIWVAKYFYLSHNLVEAYEVDYRCRKADHERFTAVFKQVQSTFKFHYV